MKTLHLHSSAIVLNCSRITWSYTAINFSNEIQRLISMNDTISIECGKHNFMFMLLPINPLTIPFTFPDTNMLMQLMPNEPEQFYLKAAIRGSKEAIWEVSRCYHFGVGVKKNKELADIWYDRAEELGSIRKD